MSIAEYLDSASCPAGRPQVSAMSGATTSLHAGIDDHARSTGIPYLHPQNPTVMLDLLGSANIVAWQEGKGEFLFTQEGCWSELPQIYGRYGTVSTHALIGRIKDMENAAAVCTTDCGMQACAVTFDALMEPGAHAIIMRQVYNKTKAYLERLAGLVGGKVTIVDDGDFEAIEKAIVPETVLIFAETFTNPRMRAQDPVRLGQIAKAGRKTAPNLRLIIDSTIATSWAMKRPLLDVPGVDVVLAAGTKSLAGQDRDLCGYVATNELPIANRVMDILAMRGGILDWRRATAILEGLDEAKVRYQRRCATAAKVAAFLHAHPKIESVYHPSLSDHADVSVIAEHYKLHGSLMSFRVKDADEKQTKHLADVLVTCTVLRYALSFDGLVTKVNHHPTVSEYFTPPPVLRRNGFDRLIRLGIGLEEPDDLIACLNWTLWHGANVSPDDVSSWQRQRAHDLSLAPEHRPA